MALSQPSRTVTETVARNRIQQGRYILVSLSEEKPMILAEGIDNQKDWLRLLVAVYERLGEEVPGPVVKSVRNHYARQAQA